MCDQTDKNLNATSVPAQTGCTRSGPYLALRRRGSAAVLVVVDGRKRVSTGVVCNSSSSPRARRRLQKSVLTKYLRSAADQIQRDSLH